MDWSEIVDNPYLADLPFKIEQDRYGNIVMSPASNNRGNLQVEIAATLRSLLANGKAFVEASVATPVGVKVPEVAWCSNAFLDKHGKPTPFPHAPEICVEVASPSNSRAELEEKRQRYFNAGTHEVWFCDDAGRMEFFTPEAGAEKSPAAPEFPTLVT